MLFTWIFSINKIGAGYLYNKFDVSFAWLANSNFPASVEPLTLTDKIMGIIISIPSTALIMFGLYLMISILKNYEQGQIFILKNAKFFRKLGITIILWKIVDIICSSLITLVTSLQNAVGERVLTISFGSNDFYTFVLGGAIILIGWVMTEAHNMHEEQALTI
jgi:hypothetical protein